MGSATMTEQGRILPAVVPLRCTECNHLAECWWWFGNAFSAVHDPRQDPRHFGEELRPILMKDRGWRTLRGRGRGPALQAELERYLAFNERAHPDLDFRHPAHRRALNLSALTLYLLTGWTAWWLEHLRHQEKPLLHIQAGRAPAWMWILAKEAVVGRRIDASERVWLVRRTSLARQGVARVLGISVRTVHRRLKDRAQLRKDFAAAEQRSTETFVRMYGDACLDKNPIAARRVVVEHSGYEECDHGDGPTLSIRVRRGTPSEATYYFRPRQAPRQALRDSTGRT